MSSVFRVSVSKAARVAAPRSPGGLAARAMVAAMVVACGGAKKDPPAKDPTPVVGSSSAATSSTPPSKASAPAIDEPAPPPGTLYARLGGRGRLLRIVDSLVAAIDNDPKLHKRFSAVLGSRREAFRDLLFEQLCAATGGDCKYRGRPMKEAHASLKVTEAEWNAFMLALNNALDENQVGETERLDLLSVLAPMRMDIIDVSAGRRR